MSGRVVIRSSGVSTEGITGLQKQGTDGGKTPRRRSDTPEWRRSPTETSFARDLDEVETVEEVQSVKRETGTDGWEGREREQSQVTWTRGRSSPVRSNKRDTYLVGQCLVNYARFRVSCSHIVVCCFDDLTDVRGKAVRV